MIIFYTTNLSLDVHAWLFFLLTSLTSISDILSEIYFFLLLLGHLEVLEFKFLFVWKCLCFHSWK